mmetsp:Transcript_7979/g.23516  ORF Transcript_7979/g.23516 Transcript_7979/m.23516 type:complete len:149 (+) Transcript_7979:2473-2919(+)
MAHSMGEQHRVTPTQHVEARTMGGWNPCRDLIPHPAFPGVRTLALDPVADWSALPLELVHHAACNLGWEDLCSLAAVNRACRDVASRQPLWEKAFRQRFGRPNPDRTPKCWKHLFRLNHEAFTDIVYSKRPEAASLSTPSTLSLPVTA